MRPVPTKPLNRQKSILAAQPTALTLQHQIFSAMKKFILLLTSVGSLLAAKPANSQNTSPLAAVLQIDTKGLNYDHVQMGNLVRVEFEKIGTYRVLDRYDLEYLLEKHALKVEKCYGAICLTEVGKTLGVDKILSGTVELAGDMILVQFRLIDVEMGKMERSIIRQYLNIPKETPEMVSLTLREFFGQTVNQELVRKLTKTYDFENLKNNPDTYVLENDGPRMGFTVFSGNAASRIREGRETGGYDAFPMMFQFGYQFEKQYLNEGRWQALFEFIPMITGIDQGLFIPSLTIMNGFRDNYGGWEIAFGPTLNVARYSTWYRDVNSGQLLPPSADLTNRQIMEVRRLDSRGTPAFTSGFIIAAGRTFKSGHLNIPVNLYVIPNKEGARFGFSFGFNAKNKRPVPAY